MRGGWRGFGRRGFRGPIFWGPGRSYRRRWYAFFGLGRGLLLLVPMLLFVGFAFVMLFLRMTF